MRAICCAGLRRRRKMEKIFERARAALDAGERAVLALIFSSSGSTPRGEGAKMLVLENGGLCGTIGGGPMEYAAAKAASELLNGGEARVVDFNMEGDPKAEAACGGRASVCLYPLTAADAPVFERLCRCAEKRGDALFGLWRENGVFRLFCLAGGEVCGAGMDADERARCAAACEGAAVHDDERLVYCERLTAPPRVLLMGGGHVALEIGRAHV